MNLSEIAGKAADLIAEYGLAKQTAEDFKTGSMCIGGAVSKALTGNPWAGWSSDDFTDILSVAGQILIEKGIEDKPDYTDVLAVITIPWNNRPERTKEDVIALLRETARKLDADILS